MNSYTLGQVVRLSATVKNLAGALIDAGTQTIKIRPQGGTIVPVTPTHDSTGNYHYDWEPNASGIYALRLETTNPDSAVESEVNITPSAFS